MIFEKRPLVPTLQRGNAIPRRSSVGVLLTNVPSATKNEQTVLRATTPSPYSAPPFSATASTPL
jgi:hypothetical protein